MSEDKKLDLAVKAAWLSYVAGHTQDEIARELGVSRQTAQRLVAQALAAGIVRVRIDHPLTRCLELAEGLRQRFGLSSCEVTPAAGGLAGVAMTVATLIERELLRPDPIILAIGTGRTLHAAAGQVMRVDSPQHRIVSLTGNIAPDGSTAYYNVLFSLADKVTARSFPLTVPVVAASREECEALHRQPGNARVIGMAREAEIALVGIGSIGPDAPLLKDGFLSAAEIDALKAQGAVGEIIGRVYDREGRFLPQDGRVASAELPQRPGARVIGTALGEDKRLAILGAIRGHMMNGLVTDEPTAAWLLEA